MDKAADTAIKMFAGIGVIAVAAFLGWLPALSIM